MTGAEEVTVWTVSAVTWAIGLISGALATSVLRETPSRNESPSAFDYTEEGPPTAPRPPHGEA